MKGWWGLEKVKFTFESSERASPPAPALPRMTSLGTECWSPTLFLAPFSFQEFKWAFSSNELPGRRSISLLSCLFGDNLLLYFKNFNLKWIFLFLSFSNSHLETISTVIYIYRPQLLSSITFALLFHLSIFLHSPNFCVQSSLRLFCSSLCNCVLLNVMWSWWVHVVYAKACRCLARLVCGAFFSCCFSSFHSHFWYFIHSTSCKGCET